MNKNEVKDSNNKYKYGAIILIIILFILIITAITMSKVGKKIENPNVAIVLSDGDLALNYIDGNMVAINDNKSHEYHVSVTNNSEVRIYYSMSIENIVGNKKMSLEVLDESNNKIFDTNDIANDNVVLTLDPVEAGKTKRFTLVFNSSKTADFNAEIVIVNDSMTKQTFGDLILLNNHINTAQTKIGKEISTFDEGLLSSKDDDGISYYFRGDVSNNYVKMGNLTFRVVRINGDGSVRLVLDDALETPLAYNENTTTDDTPVENLAILSTSSLKNELDKWLQKNLSEFSHIIVEGKYCTDLEFTNQMNELTYSSTYARIYSFYEPSYQCSNEPYLSNIGLLSIDEVIMAGAFKYETNDKFYLYNSNIKGSYFTLSTYYKDGENKITLLNVNEDGSIGNGALITDKLYIRPVLNVSLSTKVKGKGTLSNPYIIVA